MEEKIFVGYRYGRFTDEKSGEIKDYCQVFVLEDFAGNHTKDYCFEGKAAVKYSCVSPEVFKDIPINSKVRCFFDSRKKISLMQAI